MYRLFSDFITSLKILISKVSEYLYRKQANNHVFPKPDIFRIGMPKTGTTSLQEYLMEDKRVLLTKSDFYNTADWWKYNIRYHPEKVVIECNENLVIGANERIRFPLMIERLYRTTTNGKVILVIRNQIEAVISMYKHHIQHSFSGIKNYVHWPSNTDLGMEHLCAVICGNILGAALQYFPKVQIKVIFFEELKKTPQKFYCEIGLSPNDSGLQQFNERQIHTWTLLNYLILNKRKSEPKYYSVLGNRK